MNKQKGFSLTILIYLIAALAVSGIIYGFYQERKGMMKTISEQSAELGKLKEKIAVLEEEKTKLTSEIKSANNRVVYMNELKEAAEEARAKAMKENRDLKEKIKVIERRLPVVLNNSAVTPESSEELRNSRERIETLWDVYCTYKPMHEVCKPRLKLSQELTIKNKE